MTQTVQQLVALGATREQIEDWCRQRTQSYADHDSHRITTRVMGKHIMSALSGDTAMTPHLVLDGIWEPWVTMAVARHVQRGMRCMDIGACYGYFTLLMADIVGEKGHVEAWEPVWRYILAENVSLGGFANVKVVPAAMASTKGELMVNFPRTGSRFNAGDVKMVAIPEGKRLVVQRVQTLPPDAQPYDFIKIDVEGAESDVWQALAGVREASPSLTVCMEFTPKSHPDPRAFLEQLHADGFALGTVGHDGMPRPITAEEAIVPDTGDFRMLWLTRWR